VREIVEYGAVTRVPSTPPWIRGVVNLRGAVVTVVDLAVKFGLPSSPLDRRTCIVIVETTLGREETVMGVVADVVDEVAAIAPDAIEPPPPFGTCVRVEFLVGLARSGRKFLQLLDIDKVLAADELLAVREAAAPAEIEAINTTAPDDAPAAATP
jgi:purine-binding chemotaxis protein CheW